MDAVILAAGLGTRLRPHTLHTPKPLLPVRGRPLLDWTLGALPQEVDRVVVVVHYLAEQVEQYLRRQTHFRDWEVVHQEVPRGTGDALRGCQAHLRPAPFLVLNGDDLYGAADLARLAGCRAGLLVHPVDEPRRFGIAFLNPDGTLARLVEKPDLDGRHLANTGAYAFPPEVFTIELGLSARGEYEITDYVSTLAGSGTVQVVQTQFWMPIGTEETWQAAQQVELETVMRGAVMARRAVPLQPARRGQSDHLRHQCLPLKECKLWRARDSADEWEEVKSRAFTLSGRSSHPCRA